MSAKSKSTDSELAFKRATRFGIRLAEGMAGWATFAQAAHLSKMYSEYLTYLPIFEIGKGRGWETLPQKKIKRSKSGRGRFKTVDFLFLSRDHKIGIFLEVKYARFNANHCLQVTKDIRKLIELDSTDVPSAKRPKNVFKFIMIIGQQENLLTRLRKAKPLSKLNMKNLTYYEDERLLAPVEASFANSSNRSTANSGLVWAFPGLGRDQWKYWCILLSAAPWWNTLAKINTNVPVKADEVNEAEAAGDNLDDVPALANDE